MCNISNIYVYLVIGYGWMDGGLVGGWLVGRLVGCMATAPVNSGYKRVTCGANPRSQDPTPLAQNRPMPSYDRSLKGDDCFYCRIIDA